MDNIIKLVMSQELLLPDYKGFMDISHFATLPVLPWTFCPSPGRFASRIIHHLDNLTPR